jgi:peptidyl-prolyl cis-trans isomerase C
MVQIIDTSNRPVPPAPSLISVNGVAISREEIARELQNHPAGKPSFAWQEAARALAVRELLLQEARRKGITAGPLTDERGRCETEEEALLRALVATEIRVPEPDEETTRRYYQQNLHRFRSASIYEAAHILFSARQEDQAGYAIACDKAKTALAEIRRNPERFGELAKLHSDCPSGAQGGNLGQITAGQTTPEFERALFALVPGQVTEEPVPTRYGWHIIRLDRKVEGRQLPFELVAERIADYLREQVERRAAAQYIARLVSRAHITGIELAGAEEHRVN